MFFPSGKNAVTVLANSAQPSGQGVTLDPVRGDFALPRHPHRPRRGGCTMHRLSESLRLRMVVPVPGSRRCVPTVLTSLENVMSNASSAAPRTSRLGRPKKGPDTLRTEEIRLYLTPAEKQRLLDDSRTAAKRPADYLRELITGHRPAALAGRRSCDPRFLLELNAIGNNLNQAVRDMHLDHPRRHDWQQLQVLLKAALERAAFGNVR